VPSRRPPRPRPTRPDAAGRCDRGLPGQVPDEPEPTQPIRSLDDLAADTFDSDEELDEFLAFTYAERRRDVA
jgi:hypothetical protein